MAAAAEYLTSCVTDRVTYLRNIVGIYIIRAIEDYLSNAVPV